MTPASFRSLAALALVASITTQPARAQDVAPAVVPTTSDANSVAALTTAARNIVELLEVHRFRMDRIESALAYYQGMDDVDHVRQFNLLKEREKAGYQATLETYRRLLGDQDFARVAGLLRTHFSRDAAQDDSESGASGDATAAERAERVRLTVAAQAAERRDREARQAADVRSQAIARARSSQRAQLAARLESARQAQLAQRAAQAQRYQPSVPAPRPANSDPAARGQTPAAREASPTPQARPQTPTARPPAPVPTDRGRP